MIEVRFGLEETHMEERGCLEKQMPEVQNGVLKFTLSIELLEFWLRQMKKYGKKLTFVIYLRGRY